MYVCPHLFSRWLPGEYGNIAVNYLYRHSLLEKSLQGRATKKVQKTILGIRRSFYGISISLLGQGFAENPQLAESGKDGDEIAAADTKPSGLSDPLWDYEQSKTAHQLPMVDQSAAPVESETGTRPTAPGPEPILTIPAAGSLKTTAP